MKITRKRFKDDTRRNLYGLWEDNTILRRLILQRKEKWKQVIKAQNEYENLSIMIETQKEKIKKLENDNK